MAQRARNDARFWKMASFDQADGKSACANIWMNLEGDCNHYAYLCASHFLFGSLYSFKTGRLSRGGYT
jgi:hypothetical protein